MIEHLKSLLFGDDASTGTALDEVRLAAAALMVEAAMMDGCMDERERAHIGLLLRDRFELPGNQAEALLERAVALQEDSIQLFPLTKTIVDAYSIPQRIEVIEMLWEVAYADGQLHDYESNLVRRIAGLLYVPDHESGTARRRAMAKLGLSDDPLV
ncbi:MAG TPA: TerB family tellurite resistance protein [Patescibacteria group bacterium]|nr:TerB family tellurite resistance protein [Patescibacteria group bacterium]